MNKNILMVFRRFYPHIGGVESQGELLCEEFQNKGYSIDIITFKYDKSLESFEKYNGVNIYRFNNYFGLFYFLIKLNFNKKYDFIMSHQILQETLIVGILKFFKIIKIPVIGCYHSGGDKSEIMKIVKTFKFLKMYKLIYFFILKLDYLNCLNTSNKEQLQKYIIGNNQKLLNKLTFIPNGIKLKEDFGKYSKKNEIKNLLYLGRFEKEKGIFETIEAFKQVKNEDLILNIVGYGEVEIEQQISEAIKNDNRIKFLGKKIGEEKELIFKNTDLFIFPSYYSEGQSISLTEVAFYNIPIITTKVGNNYELYGDNLIYVKIKDVIDLKENIEHTILNIKTIKYEYKNILKEINILDIVNKYIILFNQTKIGKKY